MILTGHGYQLLLGDAIEMMRTLPADSVQTCVTSPPYFGLRDYLTATWEGGDAACDHAEKFNRNDGDRQATNGFAGNANKEGHAHMGQKQYRDTCGKCGARRVDQQIGLEPTVDCGRPIMKLRGDLTEKEYDYVVSRLKELGLI